MEPPNPRPQDSFGTIALVCGVAPLPLAAMGLLPFVGCLSSPLMLLAIPCAIGFGIAGLARARAQGQHLDVQALAGLVLGVLWLALLGVGVALLLRSGELQKLFTLRGH